MCAILGVLGNVNREKFEYSLNLMLHRGDDYQNIIQTSFGIFGFNRLAIENVDINNQPYFKDDILIMFNGEIYNYKNIIDRFNLDKEFTEIEVLFFLWKKYKEKFVYYLEGMFAIAIYDKKLYLFRDLFGKKPLYFTYSGIFSSEIKAILEFIPKNLNFSALSEYLAYNSPIAPNTIYKDIYQLPAGCYYDGEIKRWKDFEKKYNIEINDNSILNIEEELVKSIKKRLKADVEVGSLLSGGIDSSLVVSIASKYKTIQTFSIGYNGYNNYDERIYAKKVAKFVGTIHNEVEYSKKDFFSEFDEVLFYMDDLKGDSSYFPAYHLAKNINLKVILSGEGSDELFLGYRRYKEYYQFLDSYLPNKRWLLKYLERHYEDLKEWELFRRFMADEDVFRGINETFFQKQINKILNEPSVVNYKRYLKFNREFRFIFFDLKIWLGEVLLMKLDKMFMANGIETRTPFLDDNLVNYIFNLERIPLQKQLIKKIASKYLPEEIVNRNKKGFAYPFFEWLKEEKEFKRIIDINRKSKIFNEEYLKQILKTGHKRYKQHIWNLYLFSRFYEKNFF